MDADGDAHEHVLGAFGDAAVDAEEVGALERLEAKVVVVEVAVVDDGAVEGLRVGHDSLVRLVGNHGRLAPVLGVDCPGISKSLAI